jgi:hypothetical protein
VDLMLKTDFKLMRENDRTKKGLMLEDKVTSVDDDEDGSKDTT